MSDLRSHLCFIVLVFKAGVAKSSPCTVILGCCDVQWVKERMGSGSIWYSMVHISWRFDIGITEQRYPYSLWNADME